MPNTAFDAEDVTPANDQLRRPDLNLGDQLLQQIDPAGRQSRDDNDRPDTNRKQPGGGVTISLDQKDPAP
jgi:hypothetical protein